MKYIYLILIFGLFSCKTIDYSGVTNVSNEIYYEGEYVGNISQLEIEYYRGKTTREISVVHYTEGGGLTEVSNKILEYAKKKYPRDKIEVQAKKK
jgi:hypothetical protein